MVNFAAYPNKTHLKSMGDLCILIAIAKKLGALRMLHSVVMAASLHSITRPVVADGQGFFGRFGGWFANNVDEFDKIFRWKSARTWQETSECGCVVFVWQGACGSAHGL